MIVKPEQYKLHYSIMGKVSGVIKYREDNFMFYRGNSIMCNSVQWGQFKV